MTILHELGLLRAVLLEIERYYQDHDYNKGKLTMSVITTNDNAVRLRPSGVDRDGVAVSTDALNVAIDDATIASVTPDDANPGAYLVTPLPATDPAAGARIVVVTTTDPASGASTTTTIEFDPGVESSLSVATEIVPLGASVTA